MRSGWMTAAVLTGLAVLASAAPATAETLRVMGWVGLFDFQKPGWDRIVKDFESQNPGVTIEYIGTPFEDTLNQATVAILGHNAPDVIQISSGWVTQLQGFNALEPLNHYMTQQEFAAYPKTDIDAATYDGQVYALPWIPGPIMMGYNRDLMKEAGLNPDQPPKNWAEFTAAVDKICALPDRNGGKVYGVALRTSRGPNSAQWSIPMIWANDGKIVDAKGHVSFNTDAGRAAYKWYHDVIARKCSPEFFDIQGSRNVFAQGRAGFIFEGPWLAGLIQKLSDKKLSVAPDGDVWIAPVPADSHGQVRQLDNSNMLVITQQAKNKALAAKFIKFVLTSKPDVEYYYETSAQITTGNLDVVRQTKMNDDKFLMAFVKALPESNPIPIRDPQWNAMMDTLSLALQNVIKGSDPGAELTKADDAIAKLQQQ